MAYLELKFSLDDEAFSDEVGGDRDFAIAGVFKELIEKLMAGHLDLELGGPVYNKYHDVIGHIEVIND